MKKPAPERSDRLIRSWFSLVLQYFGLFLPQKQENCLICPVDKSGNLFGGGRWIRFSAEKPRRLQRVTGTLPRAAFRIHLPNQHNKKDTVSDVLFLVGEDGFEPSKALPADLQSVPFGHSGNPPYVIGAGGRIRTPDLLITNQLLYRLSYTSVSISFVIIAKRTCFVNRQFIVFYNLV